MTGVASAAPVAHPRWFAVAGQGLTIFKQEDGAETATLRSGRGTVIFDGFLFDHADLCRELGIRPDEGGAAVAAAAYERWRSGLFTRLDGCYLIAIWDDAERTLLLGHDALGRHPAFYAHVGGDFWFSSNLIALARSGKVPRQPNRLSLALDPLLYWPEAGETHLEAVRRVRPGHYLEVRAGRPVEHKYWDFFPADDNTLHSTDMVQEAFEPSIERAVERCLALSPNGIMLSGGIDSVTIAALAAKQRRARSEPPLVAVSARTGNALVPEELMQTRVAEALGMPHVVSTTKEWIAGRDPLRLALDLAPDLPSPTRIWWVGTYTNFYRRTAEQELTVLLTGAGGDNWLGVADTHAADLMRQRRMAELWRFVRSDIGTGGATMRSSARRLLWAGGIRPHLDSAWARTAPAAKHAYHRRKWIERLPSWLAPDRALRDQLIERLLARRTPALGPDGRAPQNYYAHGLRTLSNPYLHFENETAFHIETMCGLRLLSPYHDRELVAFFNRIPPRLLLHGDKYKGLLRPLAERHLPDLGLGRQRKDYPVEAQNRKLNELRESVSRAWAAESLEALGDLGVVDVSRARRDVTDFARKPFEDLAQSVTLMTAGRWLAANTGA